MRTFGRRGARTVLVAIRVCYLTAVKRRWPRNVQFNGVVVGRNA